MTISDLITELKQKEIEISFSAGKLKYTGPEENITPDLIEKLKENKGKLIKHFWPKALGNLMPINPEGGKVPLFIVHGDNSNYIISEYLGKDQPVYGFFHPGSEGEKIPFKNVKEMAGDYLDKIMSVYPEGPYYLLGYSFGGNLAFEIAVQLQNKGYEVPVLILIDSICPSVKTQIEWQKGVFRIIRKNFLGPVRRYLERSIKLLICQLYIIRNIPIPPDRRTFYMWIKYMKMTNRYSPGEFDGNMLLFKSNENRFSYKTVGWKNHVNDMKIVEMDGKHLEVFIGEDRTNLLRTEIEKYIDQANKLN